VMNRDRSADDLFGECVELVSFSHARGYAKGGAGENKKSADSACSALSSVTNAQ
jgi:hypothetical protein